MTMFPRDYSIDASQNLSATDRHWIFFLDLSFSSLRDPLKLPINGSEGDLD